jgi:hypothetical protein
MAAVGQIAVGSSGFEGVNNYDIKQLVIQLFG